MVILKKKVSKVPPKKKLISKKKRPAAKKSESVKTAKAASAPAPEPLPAPAPVPYKIVTAPCKRGSDQATAGQGCGSREAYLTSKPGSGFAAYRCIKCNHTWSIATGGAFNFF